jgi:hypothetical protein
MGKAFYYIASKIRVQEQRIEQEFSVKNEAYRKRKK